MLQGGSAPPSPGAAASKGKSSGVVIGIGVAVALAVLGDCYAAEPNGILAEQFWPENRCWLGKGLVYVWGRGRGGVG